MTNSSDEAPETEDAGGDTVSDPAADGGTSGDWTGEGGATEDGPATEEEGSS